MLIPSKHENLNNSIIIVGAKIIELLKKEPQNIEWVFKKIRAEKKTKISLARYYDAITFLWLTNIIDYNSNTYILNLKKSQNDTK